MMTTKCCELHHHDEMSMDIIMYQWYVKSNSTSITLKGLCYTFILQLAIEVVVVDNVAGSDLLYCNSDPH